MSRMAKITALFQEGSVLTLEPPGADPQVVWINKLSPFEQEQANHAGRIARSRRMLAIREVGTPEYDLFQAHASRVTVSAIIATMVGNRYTEFLMAVLREIRADPDWRERVEVLEHSDDITSTLTDDPEVKVMARIMTSYADEVDQRVKARSEQYKEDLRRMSPEEVKRLNEEQYVDQEGLAAFTREQQRYQVFYCLRDCSATDVDGTWDHSGCQHRVRMLDDVSEVDELPQAILAPVQEAYARLMVAPDVARFTGALPSSSGSSGSSSPAEASTDSGPAATPTEPGTTSS